MTTVKEDNDFWLIQQMDQNESCGSLKISSFKKYVNCQIQRVKIRIFLYNW